MYLPPYQLTYLFVKVPCLKVGRVWIEKEIFQVLRSDYSKSQRSEAVKYLG